MPWYSFLVFPRMTFRFNRLNSTWIGLYFLLIMSKIEILGKKLWIAGPRTKIDIEE